MSDETRFAALESAVSGIQNQLNMLLQVLANTPREPARVPAPPMPQPQPTPAPPKLVSKPVRMSAPVKPTKAQTGTIIQDGKTIQIGQKLASDKMGLVGVDTSVTAVEEHFKKKSYAREGKSFFQKADHDHDLVPPKSQIASDPMVKLASKAEPVSAAEEAEAPEKFDEERGQLPPGEYLRRLMSKGDDDVISRLSSVALTANEVSTYVDRAMLANSKETGFQELFMIYGGAKSSADKLNEVIGFLEAQLVPGEVLSVRAKALDTDFTARYMGHEVDEFGNLVVRFTECLVNDGIL